MASPMPSAAAGSSKIFFLYQSSSTSASASMIQPVRAYVSKIAAQGRRSGTVSAMRRAFVGAVSAQTSATGSAMARNSPQLMPCSSVAPSRRYISPSIGTSEASAPVI